jgi:hypothetical protein
VVRGALLFGYLLLGKQEKVTRLSAETDGFDLPLTPQVAKEKIYGSLPCVTRNTPAKSVTDATSPNPTARSNPATCSA